MSSIQCITNHKVNLTPQHQDSTHVWLRPRWSMFHEKYKLAKKTTSTSSQDHHSFNVRADASLNYSERKCIFDGRIVFETHLFQHQLHTRKIENRSGLVTGLVFKAGVMEQGR